MVVRFIFLITLLILIIFSIFIKFQWEKFLFLFFSIALIVYEVFEGKSQKLRSEYETELKNKLLKLEEKNKASNEIRNDWSKIESCLRSILSIDIITSLDSTAFHFYKKIKEILEYKVEKGIICIYRDDDWKIIEVKNDIYESEITFKRDFIYNNIEFGNEFRILEKIDFFPEKISYIINKYIVSRKLFIPITIPNKDFFLAFILEYKPIDIISIDKFKLIIEFIKYHMKNKLEFIENNSIIDIFSNIVSYLIDYFGFKKNINKIANLSVELANKMNLSIYQMNRVYISAILMDLGYFRIPKSILNKPHRLTSEEFEIVKKHPIWSSELVSECGCKNIKSIANIIKYHHERWDGKGYPVGLSGEAIPLESRIIAVADAFISMISDRPYRKALTVEEALNWIVKGSSNQFDPKIVSILMKLVRKRFFF